MHTKSLRFCPTLQPYGQQPTRLLWPLDSLGKNTGVGCHFLLQDTCTIWCKNRILNSHAYVPNPFRVLCREEVTLPLFPAQVPTVISGCSSPGIISFSSLIAVARTSLFAFFVAKCFTHGSPPTVGKGDNTVTTCCCLSLLQKPDFTETPQNNFPLQFSQTIQLKLIVATQDTASFIPLPILWIMTSRGSLKSSSCSSTVRTTNGSLTQNKTV